MRTTTIILTFLSVGAQSFSDAEIHQHDGYEQQYQQFSSPGYQNDGASYQNYAGSSQASDTGFDGIHLPGINVDPNGIHLPGMHGFETKKPEDSFEGVLPWFFHQEGTPPETCGESSLTPSQYYSLICSHLHKQEREIIPGYKVRFLCDIYGGHNGKQLPASTPERCAQLCEIDSSCIGSSWFSDKKRCILSGPLGAGFREYTIYMHRIVETARQADPFADDASDKESSEKLAECARQQEDHLNQLNQRRRQTMEAEQEFENQLSIYSTEKSIIKSQLSQCGAEKSAINNELHQCNIDKANSEVFQAQLGSCQTQQETLQTQLNQCKDEQTAQHFQSCTYTVVKPKLSVI